MGLENLKSVFQEDLNNSVEKFSSNVITNVNDTQLIQFDRPELGQLIGESPIQGMSWESLYNPNHSPKDNPSHKGIVPINYQNVSRDNLNIRNPNDGRFGFGGSTRTSVISAVGKLIGSLGIDGQTTEFLKDTGKEPYIVSPIPKTQSDLFSGRTINFGSRDFPIARSIADTIRLAKFLTSPAGLLFIGKQEILGGKFPFGLNSNVTQKYKNGYNPISTLISTFGRAGGGPIGLIDRTQPSFTGLLSFLSPNLVFDEYPEFNVSAEPRSGVFADGSPMGRRGLEVDIPQESYPPSDLKRLNDTFRPVDTTEGGSGFGSDKHTMLEFGRPEEKDVNGRTQYKDKIEEAHETDSTNGTIEGEENGMPFYFKDMRDGAFVFFRAYIEGLTENISPSYNSTQYIGRSEPVYTYSVSEREISMTLKLFAQTKDELSMIYKKMDKLTSLCYPEYFQDIESDSSGNLVSYGNRMKPPLTKLRLGELFGKSNNELMGYIKSLSYSVEQSSPFETEVGKRVPKFVTATIGYQVIHAEAPNLETKFYGINYE